MKLPFIALLLFFIEVPSNMVNEQDNVLNYQEAVGTVIDYLNTSQQGSISNHLWPCFLIDPVISIDTSTSYYYIWNSHFKEYIITDRKSKDVFINELLTGDKTSYVDFEKVIPLKNRKVNLNNLSVKKHICWEFLSSSDMILKYGKKSKPKGTYSFSPLIPLSESSLYHMALSVKNFNFNHEFLFVLKKENDDTFSLMHVYYDDFWGNSGVGAYGDFLIPSNSLKN